MESFDFKSIESANYARRVMTLILDYFLRKLSVKINILCLVSCIEFIRIV